MDLALIIYLSTIAVSVPIVAVIIWHEQELTVKDLFQIVFVLAIPVLNLLIFSIAILKIDVQQNGPFSKLIQNFNKFLNIRLKK